MSEPPPEPVNVTLGEPGTLPPEPRSRLRQNLITLALGVLVVLAVLAVAMAIVIATLPPIENGN